MSKSYVRDDILQFKGIVIDANTGIFKVKIDDGGIIVKCKPSGKLRLNKIVVLPGDRVMIECSPLDPTNGRIKIRL